MKPAPIHIPELLRQHGIYADKRLGQNFLLDETALEKVIQAAGVTRQDQVLEIGAGVGNLTRWLAENTSTVVAVEVDSRLLPILKETVGSYPNVHIIHADILELDTGQLFDTNQYTEKDSREYIVVANIPYYITSAVIRHLLEASTKPVRIVLMVQQEVGERICAPPGKLSLLSLSVQVYGKPEIVARIPAGAFYPKPAVDSVILRIHIYPQPEIPSHSLDTFFRLIRAGFSQKRKTIRNAFIAGLDWSVERVETLLIQAEIDPKRRAESLTIPEWGLLSVVYHRLEEK